MTQPSTSDGSECRRPGARSAGSAHLPAPGPWASVVPREGTSAPPTTSQDRTGCARAQRTPLCWCARSTLLACPQRLPCRHRSRLPTRATYQCPSGRRQLAEFLLSLLHCLGLLSPVLQGSSVSGEKTSPHPSRVKAAAKLTRISAVSSKAPHRSSACAVRRPGGRHGLDMHSIWGGF